MIGIDNRTNEEKSYALAAALYPHEVWVPHGERIFIAESRLTGGHNEQAKLYREIADVRILTDRGSVAYFLPETSENVVMAEAEYGLRADTVIDGVVVELKAVSGNRATLGKSFRRGFKQGRSLLKKSGIEALHSVFMRLNTPFTVASVRAKIAGELKSYADKGQCICYFEATGELYFWEFDELRGIIGT